jgi:hydroxypyruvate isomerase
MEKLSRREWIGSAGAFVTLAPAAAALDAPTPGRVVKKGRLKQSACRWCYRDIPLPALAKAVSEMGLTALDLVDESDWPVLAEHGLVCSMGWHTTGDIMKLPGGELQNGLNDPKNHDAIVNGLVAAMPRAKKAGVANLIAFFGNRKGISDADAINSCVAGLQRVKQPAEEHGINVCVELLNSKVDHKDYQGDRTSFGVEVVRQLESPRIKLLYDIYHMQIMEGDVIRTIRDNHQWIAHYHTGGVPGRHELDDTQELQWRTVAKAIVDSGYTGYYAHEFIPTRDPLTSLREAVVLCDV